MEKTLETDSFNFKSATHLNISDNMGKAHRVGDHMKVDKRMSAQYGG
jgi:hypothetical protein